MELKYIISKNLAIIFYSILLLSSTEDLQQYVLQPTLSYT